MKNITLFMLWVLLATACNEQRNNTATGSQDTTSYKTIDFYKTSTECEKDTCGAYVKASFPQFEEGKLNEFVTKLITAKPFDSISHVNIDISADSFISDYLNFKKEVPDAAGGYQWIQSLKVSYEDKNIIGFTHISYSYMGGAHGLENITYHNLAKPSFKPVSLEDILNPGYEAELTSIAEKIFRKNEGLSANDTLSDNYFFDDDKFSINNNFLITKDGLLFTYNPYEIKAYVYGNTDLLIPYAKIKDLIKTDGVLSDFRE